MYRQITTKPPVKTSQRVKTMPSQVFNDAGGAVWKINKWQQLYRFLIMGSPSDFYADETTRTTQNLDAIFACIQENALGVVQRVTEISTSKPARAVSNDQCVFILSLILKLGALDAKREALRVYNSVVRTGTDFLHSVDIMKKQRGSSRYANLAMQNWLKQPNAYFQAAKYFNRDGMNFRDALRIAHPHPDTWEQDVLFAWMAANGQVADIAAKPIKGELAHAAYNRDIAAIKKRDAIALADNETPKSFQFLRAIYHLKNGLPSAVSAASVIKNFGLPWEVVPTELRKDREIALQSLEQLPVGALLRQLGRYGAMGLLSEQKVMSLVVGKLTDQRGLIDARAHPLKILQTMMVYRQGHGDKGDLQWTVESEILDALDLAFELSFGAYVPHGKRMLFGIDISGSMTDKTVIGMSHVMASQAAVAFGALIARREPNAKVVLFDTEVKRDMVVSKRSSFFHLVEDTYLNGGGTDCSAPIRWATNNRSIYDGIVLLTDQQSWSGDQHVYQAMKVYRSKINKQARFFVAAMAGNTCTIADPSDPLSMNGVGLDTSAPDIVKEFMLGNM